jgi:signal peptidase I
MDEKNTMILARRQEKLLAREKPGVGDVIEFSDGIRQRLAIRLYDSVVQTGNMKADIYLADTYASFSGAPYRSVDISNCIKTGEFENVSFWFFDHDIWGGGRAVYVTANVHVWKCSEKAPKM